MLALVQAAPAVVSHRELLDRVWKTEHVSNAALTQAISELRSVLEDSSTEPRYIETVHRRGYRFKSKVVDGEEVAAGRLPDGRDAGPAPDSVSEFEAPSSPGTPSPPSPPDSGTASPAIPGSPVPGSPVPGSPAHESLTKGLSRSRAGLSVLFAALALILFAVLMWPRNTEPPATADTVGSQAQSVLSSTPRTLVLDFSVEEGLPPWLGGALAEMVRQELSSHPGLGVISGEELARAQVELVPDGPLSPPDEPNRWPFFQRIFETAVPVHGHVQPDGQDIRVHLELPEAPVAAVTGSVDGLPSLAQRVAQRVSAALSGRSGAEPPPPSPEPKPGREADQISAALPLDLHSLEDFFAGLRALRSHDPATARDHLFSVVDASPDSPLAHWALSRAWLDLGWEDRARAEAHRALDLSTGLPPRQRLPIEALVAELEGDWKTVADHYRALATFFPKDLDYALEVVRAETRAGRLADARQRLDAWDAPPGMARLRLDLASARLAGMEAREDARLREAGAVAAKATELGMRGIRAEALEQVGLSHAHQGRNDEALAAYADAEQLFSDYGNLWRAAIIKQLMAEVQIRAGRYAEAEAVLLDVRERMERLGNPQGQVRWRVTLARLHQYRSRTAEATPLYEQAERLCRQSGFRSGLGLVLVDQSIAAYHSGLMELAIAKLEEAGGVYRQLGDPRGEATAESNRGVYLLMLGRAAEAKPVLLKALHTFRQLGYPAEFNVLENLGNLEGLWGDPAHGRALLNQALDGYRGVNRRPKVAHGLLSLGRLERRIGNLEAAQAAFSSALELFLELRDPLAEALARSELLITSIPLGHPATRTEQATALARLQETIEDPSISAQIHEAFSALAAVNGDLPEAERRMRRALELASEKSPVIRIEELRLAHTRLLMVLGRLNEADHQARRVRTETLQWAYRRGQARVELVMAEIALAKGDVKNAEAWLTHGRETAGEMAGLADQRMWVEARLALKSGRTADAPSVARELAERAQSRGDALLSLRAKRLQVQALNVLGDTVAAHELDAEIRRRATDLGLEHLVEDNSEFSANR